MKVVRLISQNNDETVEVLECMLTLARRGELSDFLATYRRCGKERVAYTGLYRHSPAHALKAAMRMSIALTGIESQARGAP